MTQRLQLAYPLAKINDRYVTSLQMHAGLRVPWRTLNVDSPTVIGTFKAFAGYRKPGVWEVFMGEASDLRAQANGHGEMTAHSLKQLRQKIKGQFFQDANLETVLKWIGGEVSLPMNLTVTGPTRRHYCLKEDSAWGAITSALFSWRRTEYVCLELDDYSLYIGPEPQSPFATAPIQAILEYAKNIYNFDASSGKATIVIPAMPWLRPGHRIQLEHPKLSGLMRIESFKLVVNRRDTITKLGVLSA